MTRSADKDLAGLNSSQFFKVFFVFTRRDVVDHWLKRRQTFCKSRRLKTFSSSDI